jgi:hypothetical protein
MDAKHLRREIAVVKQPAAKRRRQQRDDLLAQALKKGLPAVALLLDLVEAEAGDLRVNARLRRLIALEPAEFADAIGLIHGPPR